MEPGPRGDRPGGEGRANQGREEDGPAAMGLAESGGLSPGKALKLERHDPNLCLK